MLLERTISQLDIGQIPQNQAEALGHMGYMQWLGSLRGQSNYIEQAMHAYELAHPFKETSPAVAVFCDLLLASVEAPLTPLNLKLPKRARRGGARARRAAL